MEPTTLLICKSVPPTIDKKRQRRFEIFYSVFLCLHKEINASRFSGPEPLRTIFHRRAVDLSFVLKPRFFNAFSSAFFSALNFFQCILQCIFQWKNVLPSNWISSVQKWRDGKCGKKSSHFFGYGAKTFWHFSSVLLARFPGNHPRELVALWSLLGLLALWTLNEWHLQTHSKKHDFHAKSARHKGTQAFPWFLPNE